MPDLPSQTILHKVSARLHKVSASNAEVEESAVSPSPRLPVSASSSTLQSAARADLLRSGDILHVRRKSFLGAAIRRAIGSWGNHDALLVRLDSNLWAGDATFPRAQCTTLAAYDAEILAGTIQVIVLRPTDSTVVNGSIAAAWWIENVLDRFYDCLALPVLLVKAVVGDRFPWPVGCEWAWYCTEGCRDSWRNGAGLDPWEKTKPTPGTTEKRLASGAFTLIWSSTPDFPVPPVNANTKETP
jgi:hypothetical protein